MAFKIVKKFKIIKNSAKYKGFTLAEVLITFVIVGIIATLVMPGILIKIEKHRNAGVLKRATSEIQNYIVEYKSEMGNVGSIASVTPFSNNTVSSFANSFVNYLITKKGFKSTNYGDQWGYLKYYNDSNHIAYDYVCNSTRANLNNGTYCISSPTKLYALSFFNDATIGSYPAYGPRYLPNERFIIGVNLFTNPENMVSRSSTKNKNVLWGRDVFRFFITTKGRIVPNGSKYCGGYNCQVLNANNCAKGAQNFSCFQKIINDGWQIKYNY